MTILCICTYFKGVDFLKTIKSEGFEVLLLTDIQLKTADWPRESIDEYFYLENVENNFETNQKIIEGVAHIMRSKKIDWVVALDDFDVEKAAMVREHFRIPGMGQTTARYFRDKLAMRMQAQGEDINVPDFCSLFNIEEIANFLANTSGPWLIKPRAEASAIGIKKVWDLDQAWEHINCLGENRHNYLIECFKPGDVFHVDSLILDGKVIFVSCSQYLSTPFEVAHDGGIFSSISVDRISQDYKDLVNENNKIITAFKITFSACHTEFIKNTQNNKFYFLETASRVGGAHIAEMVEAGSGINLWQEWAKIESAMAKKTKYILPKQTQDCAAIIISLTKHEHADYEAFTDKEIVWKLEKDYHIGLIIKAKNHEKTKLLLEKNTRLIFEKELNAFAPAPDKPTH